MSRPKIYSITIASILMIFSLKGNFGLANLEHEISEVHPILPSDHHCNCHHGMAIMILIGSFLIDFRQIRLRLRNYAEPKKRCFIRTQIGIQDSARANKINDSELNVISIPNFQKIAFTLFR